MYLIFDTDMLGIALQIISYLGMSVLGVYYQMYLVEMVSDVSGTLQVQVFVLGKSPGKLLGSGNYSHLVHK